MNKKKLTSIIFIILLFSLFANLSCDKQKDTITDQGSSEPPDTTRPPEAIDFSGTFAIFSSGGGSCESVILPSTVQIIIFDDNFMLIGNLNNTEVKFGDGWFRLKEMRAYGCGYSWYESRPGRPPCSYCPTYLGFCADITYTDVDHFKGQITLHRTIHDQYQDCCFQTSCKEIWNVEGFRLN